MDGPSHTRQHPIGPALAGAAAGAAGAVLAMWALGTPWKRERVVERIVEKPVVTVVEKVVERPAPRAPELPPRADLIVVQKSKALGLGSGDFGEYFVTATRALPGVERVSEGLVDVVTVVGPNGAGGDSPFLLQGWKPDNFGYEDLTVLDGRALRPGDSRKVLLGRKLAEHLAKKVGDVLTFEGAPDAPYTVIGVFESRIVFENGGAVVPLKDAQALTGKRISGFSVRVKRSSPNPAAEVAAVKKQIESLRDPTDPAVRLDVEFTGRP